MPAVFEMTEKLKKLAAFEQTWGGLTRWAVSIVFFLVVYSLLHFADLHFVTRGEFVGINSKLDALVATVTQNTTRLQDVQQRVHRIENLQDSSRDDLGSAALSSGDSRR